MADSFRYTLTRKAMFGRTVGRSASCVAKNLKLAQDETDPIEKLRRLHLTLDHIRRARSKLDAWERGEIL